MVITAIMGLITNLIMFKIVQSNEHNLNNDLSKQHKKIINDDSNKNEKGELEKIITNRKKS